MTFLELIEKYVGDVSPVYESLLSLITFNDFNNVFSYKT